MRATSVGWEVTPEGYYYCPYYSGRLFRRVRSGVPLEPKNSASDHQLQPWTPQDLEPCSPVVPKVCQPRPGKVWAAVDMGPGPSEAQAEILLLSLWLSSPLLGRGSGGTKAAGR